MNKLIWNNDKQMYSVTSMSSADILVFKELQALLNNIRKEYKFLTSKDGYTLDCDYWHECEKLNYKVARAIKIAEKLELKFDIRKYTIYY